jgi:actin-related protein
MVEYTESMIKTPIVIDNVSINDFINNDKGSGVMKAGLGGEDKPALVFNS